MPTTDRPGPNPTPRSWPTSPPEQDWPESINAPGPEAARHFRAIPPPDPSPVTPDNVMKLPTGAVLRLASGQLGQLYFLWDGPHITGPAVLLFGVETPQPLIPADYPAELVTMNQYRDGVVLDEVSDPSVSAALDNALKTRT